MSPENWSCFQFNTAESNRLHDRFMILFVEYVPRPAAASAKVTMKTMDIWRHYD